MDKNQAIGIGLMIGIVLIWSVFFGPENTEKHPLTSQVEQQEEEATSPTQQSGTVSIIQAENLDSTQLAIVDADLQSRFGAFGISARGDEKTVVIENNKIKAEINTHGGFFELVSLQDGYKTYWDSTNIQLWDPELSAMSLGLNGLGVGKINTSDLYFQPSSDHVKASETSPGVLNLRLSTQDPNQYLEIVYTLEEDSYEVKCKVNFVGLNRVVDVDTSSPQLNWTAAGWHNEKGIDIERQRSSVFYRYENKGRDYLGERRDNSEDLEERLNWMAFKQNYFTTMVISDSGLPSGGIIRSRPPEDKNDTLHTMYYDAQLNLDATTNTVALRFFFGPNNYEVLQNLKVEEVTKIIDYGWWIFGWVNRNFIRPVFLWLSGHIASAGLIIIILTLMIKLILFPITWKNYLSSAKMRVLRPEIEEINKKFEGKDAMEKQQATMALYKQTGVNPLAGCLPMLLQLPILYAMFRFFPASIELRGKGFLWAEDLGTYDQIVSWTNDIPVITGIYGNHVSGFTLLMAISTFFYTRMSSSNMPTQSQPGMPNMKVIMNIFPFMMLIFFNKFAAGLSFYYFAANFISILQMYSIKKWFVSEEKIRAKIEVNKKKPKKKMSAFQKRLKDAQQMQKQQMKNKKKK